MRHLSRLVAIVICFNACVSPNQQDPDDVKMNDIPVFPDGKYVHAVKLEVPGHGSWQLQGVMHLTNEHLQLVALSPMGTTVFKIEDEYKKNSAQIVVYQPELKAYEQKFLDFYVLMRPHFAMRYLALTEVPDEWDVRFFHSKKTPELPATISIRAPQFSLRVEVEQYEP